MPPADMRTALSETIRSVVLPRLLAARKAHDLTLAHCGKTIEEQDIAVLLSHIGAPDENIAEASLTVLALRGVPREDILIDLFQPVAERLGEYWKSDRMSFADVTLAIGRLKRLMRSPAMPRSRLPASAAPGRLLVAGMPGEQHTLGVAIVADLFSAAGWDAATWSGENAEGLQSAAAASHYDIVGISISDQQRLNELKPLAERLRRSASKRLVGIMAGGRVFGDADMDPGRYGVDVVAPDARRAVRLAEALLHGRG